MTSLPGPSMRSHSHFNRRVWVTASQSNGYIYQRSQNSGPRDTELGEGRGNDGIRCADRRKILEPGGGATGEGDKDLVRRRDHPVRRNSGLEFPIQGEAEAGPAKIVVHCSDLQALVAETTPIVRRRLVAGAGAGAALQILRSHSVVLVLFPVAAALRLAAASRPAAAGAHPLHHHLLRLLSLARRGFNSSRLPSLPAVGTSSNVRVRLRTNLIRRNTIQRLRINSTIEKKCPVLNGPKNSSQ